MYTDPSNLREKVVKVRFNELEAALVDAWVNYHGQQKAAFVRELILEQARLDIAANLAPTSSESEVPQLSLFRA